MANVGKAEVKVGAEALRTGSKGNEDVEITADTIKCDRAISGFDEELDADDKTDGAVWCDCWFLSWCWRGCLGERDFRRRAGAWCE